MLITCNRQEYTPSLYISGSSIMSITFINEPTLPPYYPTMHLPTYLPTYPPTSQPPHPSPPGNSIFPPLNPPAPLCIQSTMHLPTYHPYIHISKPRYTTLQPCQTKANHHTNKQYTHKKTKTKTTVPPSPTLEDLHKKTSTYN